MSQPLSPAAQAVLDAYGNAPSLDRNYAVDELERICIAAALRAAADEAAPEKQVEDIEYVHQSYVDGMKDALAVLFEIADELSPGKLMTTKSQLQSKIQELEAELQQFKSQLSSYKETPTLQEASVGDVLEDGSIVLSKENGIAILVAPKETEVYATWSQEFTEVFDALKTYGLNPSQWFIPSKELLNIAWETIPSHFASAGYWSSTEPNATIACLQSFTNGDIFSFSKFSFWKSFTGCVRAFRCSTY